MTDLTEKQQEAIRLVAEGFTSKEAARILDIAPKTFDRRVDVVRRKFGVATRGEAVRVFREIQADVEFSPYPPSPLTPPGYYPPANGGRSEEEHLHFADSLAVAEPVPLKWLFAGAVSELRPSQLGVPARVLLMLTGALLISSIFLLGLGIADGLQDLRTG